MFYQTTLKTLFISRGTLLIPYKLYIVESLSNASDTEKQGGMYTAKQRNKFCNKVWTLLNIESHYQKPVYRKVQTLSTTLLHWFFLEKQALTM